LATCDVWPCGRDILCTILLEKLPLWSLRLIGTCLLTWGALHDEAL